MIAERKPKVWKPNRKLVYPELDEPEEMDLDWDDEEDEEFVYGDD